VRLALVVLAALVLAMAGFVGAVYAYVARVSEGLPTVAELRKHKLPPTYEMAPGAHRVYVPFEAIPPRIIQAFLAAEDKNFYHRNSANLLSSGVAQVTGQKRGLLQGGSTITQQLAKSFNVGHGREDFERDVREIVLARRLEKGLTKDQILELYLNEIYLGRSCYGVGAASQQYFGKPLGDLSLGETAFLASLPKAPGKYNLSAKKDLAIARRNYVLDRMVANAAITQEQADAAKMEDLVAIPWSAA
jgi:penicillin-binding protein 1A